ncbi:MAG: glycoside hydrolase family 2 TIM barrel-domain containing protein [Oscillospiraceae bacterium]|nr:glycoside hydrolase family 2 TIM barrel-domain containing protein [Oscillospiraceae bacterium]
MLSLNNGWEFTPEWNEDFLHFRTREEKVRLPHNVKEEPLHYIDHKSYEMISGYRKKITIPMAAEGKRVFVCFEGAAHIATVYVNGEEKLTHLGGYTAFEVELTSYATAGDTFEVAVKLDSTENPTIPPFGYVIDYLTYGGIYRPVWMDIRERDYITDVFVTTPDLKTAVVRFETNKSTTLEKTVRILDDDGGILAQASTLSSEVTLDVFEAKPWDLESPNLYRCVVSLENGGEKTVWFGFRTAVFKADGFYLNGKRTFLRGLDRHQSYPYVGYAVPDSLQIEDARILKEELACTAVRTSHYPQSQSFIDACDRLGLLVFTEIPGWQHIGDEDWKDVACKQVEEMVLQYRNHPSIVLWGVRINESQDDDAFYERTNRIAHELDPSRQTSGVRYLKKSHLLEDVYAFNDFTHSGDNEPITVKSKVTPDMSKGLLISEANGHMFPTKSFDKSEVRQEHALRHARVMNAAMGTGEHAGCFEWCMFDYPTHKDFGSGDRVCYHGVMDAFRNPKLAASVYAMQGDDNPVLEVGSSMDIGDYPGGMLKDVYVFSNGDSVKLYKNGAFVSEFTKTDFTALPHGPMLVDDTIGDLLRSQEGFTGNKEKLLHDCLLSASRNGANGMPIKDLLKMGWAMLRYHLTYSEGVDLYGKYVGNWGGEATVWRFDSIKDGNVVCSKTLCPSADLHIEAKTSTDVLTEGDTYDMAAVRIRIMNEYGNVASYAQLPISFRTEGEIELVGPKAACAEGGMTGTYVRTTGNKGTGKLFIEAPGLDPIVLDFRVK